MDRFQHTLLAALAALVLSGCASMSAEECMTADWRTIGFEDGAKGLPAASIARHRKACAKAGVTADQRAYEAGRQDGLVEFCRPTQGYEYGRRGGHYQGVCPADLEDAFLQAYEDGRHYYELEQGVRNTERELSRVERELDKLADDLAAGEAKLIEGGGTAEERAKIVDNNREIATEIGELENARAGLLIELGERRAHLQQYQGGGW